MVLGLIRVHYFNFQILIGAKMSLFLEMIRAYQCILITKKKDILSLGKGATQGFDNTKLTAEAEYSVNFSRSNKLFFKSAL